MRPKKNAQEIRNEFLYHGALRERLLQKVSDLSSKERRLLDDLRNSCLHDDRSLHFTGDPQVRFCFICGMREEAVDGVFSLIKGSPLRYVRDGRITDPGVTVGPAVVQKMFSSLVSRTRERGQKPRENSRT